MSDRRVLKYDLPVTGDTFVLQVPQLTILTLQVQRGVPVLWCDVQTASMALPRHFVWVGTGHSTPQDGTYVGTVQAAGGDLVLHLFEIPVGDLVQ